MPSLAWPMQARLNSIPLTEGTSAAVARRLIIARVGGLEVILDGAKAPSVDLRSQCARALRNLSVNADNKARLRDLGAIPLLRDIAASRGTRAAAQAQRALENLEASDKK